MFQIKVRVKPNIQLGVKRQSLNCVSKVIQYKNCDKRIMQVICGPGHIATYFFENVVRIKMILF